MAYIFYGMSLANGAIKLDFEMNYQLRISAENNKWSVIFIDMFHTRKL